MAITFKYSEIGESKFGRFVAAQKVGEVLLKLGAGTEGFKPQAVVDHAFNRRSPLHKLFEWDDAKAGAAYRLQQARWLVASIYVEGIEGTTEDVSLENARAFHSVRRNQRGYHDVEAIRNDWELQTQLLRQADKELSAMKGRYRSLKDVCDIIDEARSKISERAAGSKPGATV